MTAAAITTASEQRECPRGCGRTERWPLGDGHANDRFCADCRTWWRSDAAGDLREVPA